MVHEYMRQREDLDKQIRECMPLIEAERAVYIRAEYGRLQSIIGTGYWDKEAGRSEIFHGRTGDDLALIDDRPKDPYDITVEELEWITRQYKHIERCGTDTYLNFFNMMPEDRERIRLIAGMWRKLTHEELCTEQEVRTLREGHDGFTERKLSDPVKVIR